jgi:hypothetical protein
VCIADLKHAVDMDRLHLPIKDYLRKYAPGSLLPLLISLEDSCLDVATRMLSAKMHHAWCTDPDGKPIGCLSQSDVLFIASH